MLHVSRAGVLCRPLPPFEALRIVQQRASSWWGGADFGLVSGPCRPRSIVQAAQRLLFEAGQQEEMCTDATREHTPRQVEGVLMRVNSLSCACSRNACPFATDAMGAIGRQTSA
jgi:hypothetical protein